MNDSARPCAGGSSHSESMRASLVCISKWTQIFAQVYREDLTEELSLAYRVTLQGCPAATLEVAFPRAMQRSRSFRPCPGEVFEEAEIELLRKSQGPRPAQLPEARLTVEEAWAEWEDTQKARAEFFDKLHAVQSVTQPPKPTARDSGLVIADPDRVRELERQKQQIIERDKARKASA